MLTALSCVSAHAEEAAIEPLLEPTGPRLEVPAQLAEPVLEEDGLPAVMPSMSSEIPVPGGEDTVPAGGRSRRWRLRPHVRVTANYDDNIFITNKNKEGDFIFSVAPGFAFGAGAFQQKFNQLSFLEEKRDEASGVEPASGNYIFFDYTANILVFADHSSQDTVDQDAALEGKWEAGKLTLGLDLHFQSLSGADVDVGGRVRRYVYFGAITSRYDISSKTWLEANFFTTATDFEERSQVDSIDYSNQDWFNFQVSPKIAIGLGVTLGYVQVQDSSDQVYEQALGRLIYTATGKLSFSANAGVEFRQLVDFDDDSVQPVFGIGATYLPFDGTQITLDAYRRVQTAASLINENIVYTGVEIRARQRFFERYFFTLILGYYNADYEPTAAAVDLVSRQDNYFYVRPSFAFNLTKWGSVEFFYEYRNNDSTRETQAFDNQQAGVQVNLLF